MSSPSSLEASYILVEGERRPTPPSPLVQEPPESVKIEKPKIPTAHPSSDTSYKPGGTPHYAHDWSSEATGGLRLHGRHFLDAYGRVCNLRGVNLSGSSKIPIDHDHENFPGDHRSVTFVGRPFPLEEADEHFARLRRWGLTFIRFLVTWEAIEHAGPGIYDKDYLNYLRELLSLLPKFGISAFVSIHQDVWSRYTGGSGAPAWTLELVGLDLHAIEDSGAAWLRGMRGGGHSEAERGLWPCGYQKLAAATMATCFWAGDTFAPKLFVKDKFGQDISIQQFLQSAFISACDELARAVGELPGVIGFQMMNEPHRGYIQIPSLHAFDYNTDLHLSHVPTAFQSFQLGAGHPTTVATWTRSFPVPTRKTSETLLNAEGRKAWRDDGPTQGKCLWEVHGLWGWDKTKNQAVALRESYFKKHPVTGKEIDWYTDFYYPFVQRWSERMHTIASPDKFIFVESIPNEFCPTSWTPEHRPKKMVFAPHWYDLHALFGKSFGDFNVNVQGLSRGMFPLKGFYWGQKGVRENYTLQIRNIVENGYKSLGETPAFIGECGIPMDMNHRAAFQTDDFTWQTRMMDGLVTALDKAMVGFTLWNYNPYNDDERGDDWNGENFSWFSKKRALPRSLLYFEQTAPSLDQGGRILSSVVRPYPAKTAGIPLKFEYEMTTGAFTFEWANPEKGSSRPSGPSVYTPPLSGHPAVTALETEIFLPHRLTLGRKVVVAGLGKRDSYRHDEERQTLFILSRDETPGAVHRVTVSVRPEVRPEFELNDLWSDFGGHIFAIAGVIIALIAVFVVRYLQIEVV